MTYIIMQRSRVFNITDPQRRVYDGHVYKSEEGWGAWEELESWQRDKNFIEKRLQFWRELNDYAVGQRGKSARKEFKALEVTDELH